ncbi:HEPN domain-containing protein [Mucilaginibacter robiniae]|uniref:HEPN domain-containing protein n=1 Tax=Mucilaginibacter robiniae TaxID=2728022 RepID=A0A7L5E5F9_9SPHI|nr:HEPN domain-containing protein [Mucilaginibacter robiniae]QJD98241.1 HEPN domain-containing protein [Mucilaginibacter robiniae]
MYIGTYAPWENAPKLLRHDEMINPLKVVIDFFEIDDMEGHAKHLKQWRDYAVRLEYYVNERNGPGMLLYVWEEHVRLMEAMFLLWHEHRNIVYRYKPPTAEQLAEERSTWDYFPMNLDDSWLANPYLVIQKFFETYDLAVYRDHLYEWLHMALTRTENRDPDLDAEEVITVYENILELYAAAWIICQRNSDRPHLKRKKVDISVPSGIPKLATSEPLEHLNIAEQVREASEIENKILTPLYPKPSPAGALGLQKLKEAILEGYPAVQLIVYLGCHAEPFTYYLLLLISEEEKTEEGQLCNAIEGHLQRLAHTHIILHKASSAKTSLIKGSRFWNMALSQGHLVYQSNSLQLEQTVTITKEVLVERAHFHWNYWGQQGHELLKGAAFYHEGGNYRQAAFLLHKATETILKAVIQAVLGYRIQMHNISRLLRLTLLFTESMKDVFQLDTPSGVKDFTFLKNAYAQAHYSKSFDPDQATIAALNDKITLLYSKAEAVYQCYLQQLEENL